MAAAAVSLSCPPRRSSRLAHAHAAHNPSPSPLRQPHILKHHRHHRTRIPIHVVDSEPDPDSSSSDPENELTPRALRALKRQRLALDFDGLSISHRGRPKKKRKENIAHADPATATSSSKEIPQLSKRPSSPSLSPLTPKRTFGTDRVPSCENAAHLPSIPECSVDLIDETSHPISISLTDDEPSAILCSASSLCGSSADQSPISMLTDNANSLLSSAVPDTQTGDVSSALSVPPISTDVRITSVPSSPPLGPCAPSSPEPEPLTPLTPLTPSPSPSPSLSGHDRHTSSRPPSPLNESVPLPVPVESATLSSNPHPPPTSHPPLSAEDRTSSQPTLLSPHPSHLSLDPPLDNLISFDSLPSNFDSGVPLHLDAHHDNLREDSHPHSHAPQLPGHFPSPQPDQAHSPQVQYVRPPFTQVPGRDREVNIWKLACQERVESLFRRYGVETIKAIIASEAGSAIVNESPNSMPTSFPESSTQEDSAHATQPPQTRFRLYTPASYTWSSRTVLGSGSSPGKQSSNNDPQGMELEREAMWMESDLDVDLEMDIDVDMDDDDEDYEDEDEIGELEGDADGESRAKLDLEEPNGRDGAAMQPLGEDLKAMDAKGEVMMMDVDCTGQSQRAFVDLADKENNASTSTVQSPSLFATSDESSMATSAGLLTMPLPSTGLALPLRHQFPPLSSLHVPLLSEPPRAFMGRGTPPDRRRLMEWSVSGRYPGCQTQAIGVGLFVSPRNPGINTVPMSMASMHSTGDVHQGAADGGDDRPQPHQHAGEWTSFLYAMLEGDGISSCQVDGNVSSAVCRGSSNPGNMNVSTVTATGSTTDMTGWYELGLPSMHMGDVASGVTADMSLSHHPHATHVSAMEQPGDEANSSTLRFALG